MIQGVIQGVSLECGIVNECLAGIWNATVLLIVIPTRITVA